MVIGVPDRFKPSPDLSINPFFTSPLMAGNYSLDFCLSTLLPVYAAILNQVISDNIKLNDLTIWYICIQFKFLKLMALLKLWKEIFQNLVINKFVSRYKHVAYAIVIPLLKKDYS